MAEKVFDNDDDNDVANKTNGDSEVNSDNNDDEDDERQREGFSGSDKAIQERSWRKGNDDLAIGVERIGLIREDE